MGGTGASSDKKTQRAAVERGRRAGVKGIKPTETSIAYLNGYRIGTETRSGKPSRMGRPRKPTSATSLNPDQWADLAIAYADGHAARVWRKFTKSRFDAWEDMRCEFREEAFAELREICRCYRPGRAEPKPYILTLLRRRLTGRFAEICSRYIFGERFREVADEQGQALDPERNVKSLDEAVLEIALRATRATTNASFTADGIGLG